MKHVCPIVQNEFGWLFEPINIWLENNNVLLHSYFASGVTAGKFFWPRSHIDNDVWFTVLVCLDYGRGIRCGACLGGSKSNTVNLILRLCLYHFLHTMSL
jgi:hypothetical protein